MLTQKYKNQESAIASYDYTDLANGLGYVIYDGFATELRTADPTYNLASNSPLGDPFFTISSNSSQTLTHNFELTFNDIRTIRGTAFVNFTHGHWSYLNNGNSNYVTITIYKGVGASYTSLGSASCDSLSTSGYSDKIDFRTRSLNIAIAETQFKKGDVLRVTASFITSYAGSSGNSNDYLYYDPADRTLTSTATTQTYHSYFKVHIPFVIDA